MQKEALARIQTCYYAAQRHLKPLSYPFGTKKNGPDRYKAEHNDTEVRGFSRAAGRLILYFCRGLCPSRGFLLLQRCHEIGNRPAHRKKCCKRSDPALKPKLWHKNLRLVGSRLQSALGIGMHQESRRSPGHTSTRLISRRGYSQSCWIPFP